MVTANFKGRPRAMSNESFVEKYARAKRRSEPVPRCLFGTPRPADTDHFLRQQDYEQAERNRQILGKYEILDSKFELAQRQGGSEESQPTEEIVEPSNASDGEASSSNLSPKSEVEADDKSEVKLPDGADGE